MKGILSKTLSFLLLSSVMYALTIRYSSHEESDVFLQSLSGVYIITEDKKSIVMSTDYRRTPVSEYNTFEINYDVDYTDVLDTFWFIRVNSKTNETNNIRLGLGAGYTLSPEGSSIKQKVSAALVSGSLGQTILSLRYKLNAVIGKLSLNMILFHLGYGYEMDAKVAYKVDDVISIFHRRYKENINSAVGSDVISNGVEIRF